MNPTPQGGVRGRATALLLAAVLATLSAGCADGLLPRPPAPAARFTLDGAATLAPSTLTATAATQATPATPRLPTPAQAPTLVVAAPTAAAGYDSLRMLYLRRPQALEAFAFHEWVDTPARMLAPLLVRALQGSGAFRAVLAAPSSAQAGLRLETELLRLHQDFGVRPSELRLTLRAVLVDTATRQALGWREFDLRVAAASDDPAGGVAAAQVATTQVLAELATFAAGLADQAGKATAPRREP